MANSWTETEAIPQRLSCAAYREIAEPKWVASQKRAQVLRVVCAERITLPFDLLDDPRLVGDCREDDGVGVKLVGDQSFFLVEATVGSQDAVTPEMEMGSEVVIVLTFARLVRHGSHQITAVNPA